jgi:hypothetical protein
MQRSRRCEPRLFLYPPSTRLCALNFSKQRPPVHGLSLLSLHARRCLIIIFVTRRMRDPNTPNSWKLRSQPPPPCLPPARSTTEAPTRIRTTQISQPTTMSICMPSRPEPLFVHRPAFGAVRPLLPRRSRPRRQSFLRSPSLACQLWSSGDPGMGSLCWRPRLYLAFGAPI